ncbi:PBP1A family penicillin-binding protein [candidate division KSB1 bacterium]|nr:PBP1A family penicillin-binding protein [candidate division KSB1 bacterium]
MRRRSVKNPPPKRTHHLRFVLIVLLLTIGGMVAFGLFLNHLRQDLPSLTRLEQYDPRLVTRIYSSDGEILKEIYTQRRVYVSLDQMPNVLKQAVIATEDRRFYLHWGVDLKRFFKAVLVNLSSLSYREGFSSITQQLAKMLYFTQEKTITRKLKEILTAIQIERTYSKREILEMYLTQSYFGHGAYGVQAAARTYFDKNVEDLSAEKAALLVALLKSPTHYSPFYRPEAALRRRNLILYNMYRFEYLSRDAYGLAKSMPIVLKEAEREGEIAPYFDEYVRQKLEVMQKKLGVNIYREGLSIYTTLDARLQRFAEEAIEDHLPELQKKVQENFIGSGKIISVIDSSLIDSVGIDSLLADSEFVDSLIDAHATVQVAFVALNPQNGHIWAMVGGRDFAKSKFNRAVQARRQPGSAFKPFLYTAAVDNGYAPSYDELLNQDVVIIMEDGTRWTPQNYDRSRGGRTTLRVGLAKSLNLIAVHLIQEIVRPKQVIQYARRMGITTPLAPYDALALGASSVIPIEIVSAFGVFPNKGVWVKPVAILRIEDRYGNLLHENTPEQYVALSEETAYIMTDMLKSVVTEGTGGSSRWKFGFYRPCAGKTGTTNDFTDAWFIGFTPQIVAGIWVGLDDPQTLGEHQEGARAALPVWARFMKMTYDSLKWKWADFERPGGVVELEICKDTKKIATGYCPNTVKEIFNRKYMPTERCDVHTGVIQKKKKKRTFGL